MRERVVLLILCIGRRCGDVSFPLDIHLFSLIFPFPKGKTSEYRANNEWINDDATTFEERVAEGARQCCRGLGYLRMMRCAGRLPV